MTRMTANRVIDCHAHIIDPARFPYAAGPGYKPRPNETGPKETYCGVLDGHGVAHALLVQPSGYGYDNAAMLDAIASHPGRFKGIAVVDPETPERELAALAECGVVGVRFNLVSYERDALTRPNATRFLARLKALGWHAQIFADDAQWPEIADILRKSGVKVLIDHFGVRDLAAGLEQPGFQAVLRLGREGNAAVKLSAPFRISREPGTYVDLKPFARAAIEAFGVKNCVWGSDWPFINMGTPMRYAAARQAVEHWLDDTDDLGAVLCRNPVRLFGFGG
jgi:predicted TIM-barrel fold metal-dependent hydrolase